MRALPKKKRRRVRRAREIGSTLGKILKNPIAKN